MSNLRAAPIFDGEPFVNDDITADPQPPQEGSIADKELREAAAAFFERVRDEDYLNGPEDEDQVNSSKGDIMTSIVNNFEINRSNEEYSRLETISAIGRLEDVVDELSQKVDSAKSDSEQYVRDEGLDTAAAIGRLEDMVSELHKEVENAKRVPPPPAPPPPPPPPDVDDIAAKVALLIEDRLPKKEDYARQPPAPPKVERERTVARRNIIRDKHNQIAAVEEYDKYDKLIKRTVIQRDEHGLIISTKEEIP